MLTYTCTHVYFAVLFPWSLGFIKKLGFLFFPADARDFFVNVVDAALEHRAKNIKVMLKLKKNKKKFLIRLIFKPCSVSCLIIYFYKLARVTRQLHYSDVIMSAMASQIIGVTIVYSTVCPGVDQTKHQSSTSLAFMRGIHRSQVNSPHTAMQ